MKKLVLIAVLCVSSLSANAQNNAQSLLQQLLGNDATSGTLKNILEDVVGPMLPIARLFFAGVGPA